MQVSHQADHITHAVMGSPESIEMAVTDSADFMIMMSSTLYTNQKLAVVRETLCNAWDAHIEAGITDQAISITLTNDTLIIRDYGKGIPHALIGSVYGTFGNSTKKNDGMQTGGFGLGCKSPFAYVEHFQVTSYCEGTKTIYTMSKSSAAVGGKPAINKIVSLPTQETGLEVSIKIQSHDVGSFRQLLYRIVRNGEMKARLNEDLMPVLPFSTAKHDFLVLSDNPNQGETFHRIMVRYGNVIYPVPEHSELQLKGLKGFLETLPGSAVLVLQAPPHSISVTPSREALSMKEQTLKTLQTLVGNFQKLLNRHLNIEIVKVFDAGLAEAVRLKHDHEVLSPVPGIPYLVPQSMNRSSNQYFASPSELAKYQVSHRYPQLTNFRRMEIRKRVQAAATMGAIDKALTHTFLVEFRRDKYHGRQLDSPWGLEENAYSPWFHRRIVAPLVQRLHAAGLPAANLMAVGHGHHEGSYQRRVDKSNIYPAWTAPRLRMSNYMLYLRKIIVLSHVNDPIDQLESHNWPDGQQKYGFLNYRVTVSPRRIEEARAVFAEAGYTVIDLLEDPDALREKLANKVRAKEKKVGLLRADNALDNNWYDGSKTRDDPSKPRIATPEWVCKAAARDRQGYWEPLVSGWSTEITTTFLRLFGQVGGFYTNVTQVKKLQALPIEEYAIRKITDYIMGSENLKQFFYVDPKREDDFSYGLGYRANQEMDKLFRRILYTPSLRQHFGMDYTLTELDQQMLQLWRWLSGRSEYAVTSQLPYVKPVLRYVSTLPFHPKRFVLKQLLKDRAERLELLDQDKIRSRLNSDDPDMVAHVTKVLLTTLEG